MALKLKGSTSGFVAIDAPPVAGNNTIILPENAGSAQQVLANDITAGVTTFTQVTINRNGDITTPGTISIGGTLTYEDVTNVDAVGVITARSGIDAPSNLLLKTGGSEALRVNNDQRVLIGTSNSRGIGGSVHGLLQVEGTNSKSHVSIVRNEASAGGAFLTLGKSRSASVGGNTVVQDDDGIGTIRFSGADGTDIQSEVATISAFVDGTPGSNDMPGRLIFSTTADGAPSPTERLRITRAGDIGIGTDSPQKRLHVADYGAHGAIRVEGSGNGNRSGIEFYRETSAGIGKGGAAIWVESDTSNSNGKLRFGTASNAAVQSQNTDMILDHNGYLGIGTDNPQKTLNVFAGVGTTELIRLSQPVDASVRQEIGIGWCSNNNHIHPGAQITSLEYDVSDPRRALLFYTRGANSDSAPTERLRITSSGRIVIGHPSGVVDAQIRTQFNTKIQIYGASNNTGSKIATYSNDAYAGNLEFVKSRSDTIGTNTLVQNGDTLGSIYWAAADGSQYQPAAVISASISGTPGTDDVPTKLSFLTTADGANAPVERLRIDPNGDVILGYAGQSLYFQNGFNNSNARIQNTGSSNNSTLRFLTRAGGTEGEALRIASNGSVLVGTTSVVTDTKFVVAGNINQFNPDTGTGASTKSYVLSRAYTMSTSSTNLLTFDNWGTSAFEITVFRRDTTSPAGANVTKIYLAFHGSGTNITQASIAQESKVTRGSIHNTTFGISENNNTATLTVTGDNNGGEAQDFTFHIMGRGNASGSIVVA